MELLNEHVIVTSRGTLEVLGKKMEIDAIGVTRRYCYASTIPLMFCISMPNMLRITKVLEAGGNFVVHWPKKSELISEAEEMQTRNDAPTIDVEEAETVDCLRLENCTTYIECEVEHRIPCGDHTVFIGKVRKRVL